MFTKYLTVVATAIMAVSAQASGSASATDSGSAVSPSASAIAGIPPCVLACVVPAAELNNCTFTDTSCVCASAQFQADATACLTTNCSPSDLQAAQALQNEQCASAGVSVTGSATTTDSVPFSLSSTGAPSVVSTPSTTHTGSTRASSPASSPSASATSPIVSPPATTGSGASSPAPSTTSASSAAGVIANSGAGAFIAAVMAGVFAF